MNFCCHAGTVLTKHNFGWVNKMKAIVYSQYGTPDVLQLTDVEKPVPADDNVLVKIHAVSINGADREGLLGSPGYVRIGGFLKPGNPILASDIAGRIEQVGKPSAMRSPPCAWNCGDNRLFRCQSRIRTSQNYDLLFSNALHKPCAYAS